MAKQTQIMGILNITPDSFYDGNKLITSTKLQTSSKIQIPKFETDLCLVKQKVQQMVDEGVDIIDVGGQSALETEPISTEEELARVMPVIELMRSNYPDVQISVDTSKAIVAAKALERGVHIINDITAGRGDLKMLGTVAPLDCQYVMMYNKDTTSPARIRQVDYQDVVKTLHDFFEERIQAAENAGIKRSRLIIDPGLGHFISSEAHYSWQVLERLSEFQDFKLPILVSPSRKSFTAQFPGQPPSERLPGTLKATKLALKNGATLVRTHDVEETRCLFSELHPG